MGAGLATMVLSSFSSVDMGSTERVVGLLVGNADGAEYGTGEALAGEVPPGDGATAEPGLGEFAPEPGCGGNE